MLSGSDKYTVKATFQTAGQLVKGNEVQVGGKPVGKVTSIELTDDGQAEVEMEVDSDFEPLHDGTQRGHPGRARCRASPAATSRSARARTTPARSTTAAQIDADDTTTPVDLDQLFNTLDPKTRKGLQEIIQGGATQYDGKAEQANEAAKYFNPALSTSLAADQRADPRRRALRELHRRHGDGRRGDRRAPRRPGRPRLERERDRAGDRRRERRARARARAAAADAAQGEHHVREPARGARRPRRARRRVEARHEGPGAVLPRAAPARGRTPSRRSATCAS